jgi:drug efflux transport system permease protein
MLNPRLLALIRKEFIQIVRDRRTLFVTFFFPIMQLFLLGYAASNDVRNIPLVVFDQDRSAASRALLDAYGAADYFKLAYYVNSQADVLALIERGDAGAAITIPPDYGEQVAAGRTAQVAFLIDGSDPNVAGTALSAAVLIGQAKATNLTVQRLALHGQGGALQSAVDVRSRVLYNPDLVSAYFMIPGLMGTILQFVTLNLTVSAIVRERERGTIEQLIVTPIRSLEMIVGKLTPAVVIAFVNMLEILVAGVLLFGVPINGSLTLLLVLSALFLITNLGIGLLISTVANTQQEAVTVMQAIVLPGFFLSGFFFPIAAMPKVLQWISYGVPLRYFLDIVRGIVLKGVGVESLWSQVIFLTILAVIIMVIAAWRFRKRLD